jgi:DNA-binding MarR family transcriptional regulator
MERPEQELAVLRMMYGVGLRLGDEMRAATNCRLDQHQLLGFTLINRQPGLTQAELAEQLHRSAVQVSRLVDELEALDLAERRAHRFDRRSKVLHPTDAGLSLYRRMRERAEALAAEIFRETPDEKLGVLNQMAGDIAERLNLALRWPSAPDHKA